jgi:hypothetical protein
MAFQRIDPSRILPAKTTSEPSPRSDGPPSDRCSKAEATKRAAILLGCFRRGEANDPEVYATAVAAVLATYPEAVVKRVTDPVTGLPGRLQWLPTIAEVRGACEAEMRPIREARERERRERSLLLGAPEEDRSNRPTLEDLQAHCGGPDWGLKRGESGKRDPYLTPSQLRALAGLSEAEWEEQP